MDLCGPMHMESLYGNKYFFLLVDDLSRMTWSYFPRLKSQAFEMFVKFQMMVERQTKNKIKIIRSNRGGEFVSREFSEHWEKQGIQRELTLSYTP